MSQRIATKLAVSLCALLLFAEVGLAQQGPRWPYGEYGGGLVGKDSLIFNDEADFNDVTFDGTDFSEATFRGEALFEEAIFHDVANFNTATFDDEAGFTRATFDGVAYFNGATFKDEADFGDVTFDSLADFSGSTFNRDADFSDVTFDSLDFTGSTFKTGASFYKVAFNDEADFGGATFTGQAYFAKATFNDKAHFQSYYAAMVHGGAIFDGVDFSDVKFDSLANFSNVTFNGLAYFVGARFNDKADFQRATFDGMASFRISTFNDEADFSGSTFNKASFIDATFDSLADFREASFDTVPDFIQTRFSGTVSFHNTDFRQGVDFRQAYFDSAHTFYLENIIFPEGKLRIYWDQFQGKDNLRIKIQSQSPDSLKQHHLTRIETIYQRLRDNFLAQGDNDSADAVMYELGWQRQEILGGFWWTLYGYFFGWGYQPWRFLLFVIAPTIVIFAVIWYFWYYGIVAPILNDKIGEHYTLPKRTKRISVLKKLNITFYDHSELSTIIKPIHRFWHVLFFSTSVLLGSELPFNTSLQTDAKNASAANS